MESAPGVVVEELFIEDPKKDLEKFMQQCNNIFR